MNGIYKSENYETPFINAVTVNFDPVSQSTGFLGIEKSAFVLVNVLDIVFTILLLQSSTFYESNPIANYILEGWGFEGMAAFKLILTLVVMLIANVIAMKAPTTSRKLLWTGTAIVGAVVVYSGCLLTA